MSEATITAELSPVVGRARGYQAVLLALLILITAGVVFSVLASYHAQFTRIGAPVEQEFVAYLDDPKRQFSPASVDWLPFLPMRATSRNIGYSDSAHWLRIDLRAMEDLPPKRFLTLASPDTNEVWLFWVDPAQGMLWQTQRGAGTSAAQLPGQYPLSVFDLAQIPSHIPYVYARISSHNSIYLRPWVYSEDELERYVRKCQMEAAFISGCFFVMVLTCLLLYRHSKAEQFLWLAVCTPLLLLLYLSNKELAFRYLWAYFPNWAPAATATLMAGFLAAYSMFVASTLSLRQVAPKPRRACVYLGGSALACAILSVLGPWGLRWAIPVLHVQYAIAAVLFPAVSLLACHQGVPGALRYPALHGLFSLLIVWRLVETLGPQGLANAFVPMYASDLLTLGCIAMCVFPIDALTSQLSKYQLALWQVRRNALQNLETQVLTRTLDLETARRHSESVAQAQGHVLATMTHEMRAPLSAIIGISGLLREDRRFVPMLRSDLATVERLAHQLLQLVDQSLAHIRAQREAPQSGASEHVMMHTFVHDIETICSWMSGSHSSSFTVLCEGPVPDILQFDERALKQICINLITNAGRYCDEGAISVTFSFLRTRPGHGNLVTRVSDTGRGMSPLRMERLFEPFQPSRHKEGLGLGLSIVRKLVESCSGQIQVGSRLNLGTTFTVTIPTSIIAVPHPAQLEASDTLPASHFGAGIAAWPHDVGGIEGITVPAALSQTNEPPRVSTHQVALALQWLPDLPALGVLAQQGAYSKMEQWLAAAYAKTPEDQSDVRLVLELLEEQVQQLDFQALAATIALGTDAARAQPHAEG